MLSEVKVPQYWPNIPLSFIRQNRNQNQNWNPSPKSNPTPDHTYKSAMAVTINQWPLHFRKQTCGSMCVNPCFHCIRLTLTPSAFVEPKTELIGESTRHVKAGSQVKLRCIISQALEPPLFINWFYNQKQIYLHNRRGWRTEIERIDLPAEVPTTSTTTTTTTTTASTTTTTTSTTPATPSTTATGSTGGATSSETLNGLVTITRSYILDAISQNDVSELGAAAGVSVATETSTAQLLTEVEATSSTSGTSTGAGLLASTSAAYAAGAAAGITTAATGDSAATAATTSAWLTTMDAEAATTAATTTTTMLPSSSFIKQITVSGLPHSAPRIRHALLAICPLESVPIKCLFITQMGVNARRVK